MKVYEIIENALSPLGKAAPEKIKPMLEPFPKKPEAKPQPYSTDNGEMIKTTKTGGTRLDSGAGTFIWDKNGQPSMYITPSIGGLKQVHNIKKKTFVVDFKNNGFNIKATYDQQGNKISGDEAGYSMGGVSAKQQGTVLSFSYNFSEAFSIEARIDTAKASPEQVQNAKAMAQEIPRGKMKDMEDLVKTAEAMGGEVIFRNGGKVISQEEGLAKSREMFGDV